MLDERDLQAIAQLINISLEPMKRDMSGLKEDVSALRERVTKIDLDIENRINPSLQALAEGQRTILETLAPKSRVEVLEEEVDFLKHVVKSISQDVAELKKAQ